MEKQTGQKQIKIEEKASFGTRVLAIYSRFGILIILLLMVIAITLATNRFIQPQNLINIIRQISFIAIIGMGVTFIIITGGIDLSSGSVCGLVSALATMSGKSADSLVVGLLVGLAIGAVAGLINGFFIAKTKIPPFIATLGMMEIARGIALLVTNGRPVGGIHRGFAFLGGGDIFGIPVPIIVLLIVTVLMFLLLNKTPFGRKVMAVGGNEQAAIISGINVGKIKVLVYTLGGLLAAVAGILMTGRVDSGQPTLGLGYEMDAVASAVIGGTSLSGGVGSIWGTLGGALVIGVINNGMELLSVNAYWQQIVKGAIIIAAVVLDQAKNRKK
ncbi:MAG: ABC transporter permease [Christensenellales bacterium]|jgi:inositol transport system permease protein